MGAAEWILAGAGATAIGLLWSLIARGPRGPRAHGDDGIQERRVCVKGGYSPDRIVVRAGVPVRLVFRREETAECSESVVFPDFGTSAMLPPHRDVAIELPPSRPGEHEFTCRMGMLRGRLVIVGDGGADAPPSAAGQDGGARSDG